jgi:hypothetical protein
VPDRNFSSLIIAKDKIITIDRSLTPTRHKPYEVDLQSGKNVFSPPTILNCEAGAYIKIEEGAKLNLIQKSIFIMQGNSLLDLKTNGQINLTDNSKVELEGGSEVVMELGSAINVTTESEFIIRNGGKLIINSGAELRVNSGSKMILEDGAHLIINEGGKIIIEDEGLLVTANSNITIRRFAELLIAGTLHIKENAAFKFTGYGMVKFNRSKLYPDWQPNITGEPGSVFELSGLINNQQMMEVVLGTVHADENVKFSINRTELLMGEGTKICLSGPVELRNSKVNKNSSANIFHKGIETYGQANILVDNMLFEFGERAFAALMTLGGNAVTIKNSVFRYNKDAIVTVDKGAILENVNTYFNLEHGWHATNMTFNSDVSKSSIRSNYNGVFYSAGAASNLNFFSTAVSNNSFDGIRYAGAASLSASCGSINGNGIAEKLGSGINIRYNANLNLSPEEFPASGKMNLNGNNQTFHARCANMIYFNQGENSFVPHSSGAQLIIDGTLSDPICAVQIEARKNKWRSNNTGPRPNLDYTLSTCTISCNPTKSIRIIDTSPINSVGTCGDPVIGPNPVDPKPGDPKDPKDDKEVKLREALDKIRKNEFSAAIDVLIKILADEKPGAVIKDKIVFEKAYAYLKLTVGEAYKKGLAQNSLTGLSPEVTELIKVQDKKINDAKLIRDDNTRQQISLEKGQTLVLADRRPDAINVFADLQTWATDDVLEQTNSWLCITRLQQDLIEGRIPKTEFFNAVAASCQTSQNFASAGMQNNTSFELLESLSSLVAYDEEGEDKNIEATVVEESSTLLLSKTLKIYPNPSDGTFLIEGTESSKIFVFDLLGNLIIQKDAMTEHTVNINLSNYPPGIYMAKIQKGEEAVFKKLILQ